MELGQYFIPAGRVATAATVLLPAAGVYALYTARTKELEAPVMMGGRLRVALLAHAAYFSMLPFLFEGGLDIGAAILDIVGISPGNVPPEPDNLFWQMSNLCGELFFVAAVAYLLMARLSSVPRWTLLVPLSQVLQARLARRRPSPLHYLPGTLTFSPSLSCVSMLSSRTQVAYNLKNHLGWLVLFPYFSPTGTANLFMVADFLFIFPVALIYASAYLGDGSTGML
jgi:hypothetical protein